MKFFHLSDLHIGKRLNEFSLLEDQTYILNEILSLVDAEQPDGILIAGDVYDKSLPSAEAVTLLDHFLAALNEKGVAVFLISGNHDSPNGLPLAHAFFRGAAFTYLRSIRARLRPSHCTTATARFISIFYPF